MAVAGPLNGFAAAVRWPARSPQARHRASSRVRWAKRTGFGLRTSQIFLASSGLSLLSACGATWTLRDGGEGPITCAEEKPFFTDADADGWGDATLGFQMGCAADPESGFVVRNDLDCVDDPASGGAGIGGRTGAVCPTDFYPGGNTPAVGVIGAASELVAVLPSDRTPPVGAGQAAQTCELGWGAQTEGFKATLAVADGAVFASIQGAIDAAGVAAYAGFIGVNNASGAWKWDDGRDFSIGGVAPLAGCEGVVPEPGSLPLGSRLALIKPQGGAWCIGLPGQAGAAAYAQPGGEPTRPVAGVNDDLAAHYICSRPKPDPFNFRAPPPAEGEGGEEEGT